MKSLRLLLLAVLLLCASACNTLQSGATATEVSVRGADGEYHRLYEAKDGTRFYEEGDGKITIIK